MTKWQIPLTAQSPTGDGTWRVGLTKSKLAGLYSSGHLAKLARLKLAEPLLARPYAILQGWDRPERHDCFAYVDSPLNDFYSESIEAPPPTGKVFVVFLLPDGTIDDWHWRDARGDDPKLPDGLTGAVLWKRQA